MNIRFELAKPYKLQSFFGKTYHMICFERLKNDSKTQTVTPLKTMIGPTGLRRLQRSKSWLENNCRKKPRAKLPRTLAFLFGSRVGEGNVWDKTEIRGSHTVLLAGSPRNSRTAALFSWSCDCFLTSELEPTLRRTYRTTKSETRKSMLRKFPSSLLPGAFSKQEKNLTAAYRFCGRLGTLMTQ